MEEDISYDRIDDIIRNKIYDFYEEYNDKPNFIKIPLWIYEGLKTYMRQLLTNTAILDDDELIRYRDLVLCPTISICEYDEIEVF